MTEHQSLLAEYVRTGSDAAFRELVSAYVDLVYTTALRLVGGDTHHAEDVSQTVFADLARAARTLPAEVKLGGWLHRDTCFMAANLMRGERRRQARERQAVEMNTLQNDSEADFSQVAPLLDEAINELGEADRTAILLRFFEQQDFRAVGEALGSNEDAARMRVTRALEKLEELLKRRGVTTSAASLGVVLMANAVQAAPVGLVATISTAAALAGTTVANTATIAATKAIAMTTLQKTLITATVAVAAGVGIYEACQVSTLQSQIQTLQQQQKPLAEQLNQVTRERDDATRQLAALRDDNEQLNRNTSELLKLRGEMGMLRHAAQDSKQVESDPIQIAAKSWLAKVDVLKKWIAQRPEQKIPELQYLQDYDWLDAVKTSNMMGDYAPRNAIGGLREAAKRQFAHELSNALRRFVEEHNGDLPGNLSQLNAYFQKPMNDAILISYELLHTGKLADFPKNEWLVSEIAPPFDNDDIWRMMIRTDDHLRVRRER